MAVQRAAKCGGTVDTQRRVTALTGKNEVLSLQNAETGTDLREENLEGGCLGGDDGDTVTDYLGEVRERVLALVQGEVVLQVLRLGVGVGRRVGGIPAVFLVGVGNGIGIGESL